MQKTLRIGCFGLKGHQIHGHVRDLARAELRAFGGIPAEQWDEMQKEHPGKYDGVDFFEDFESFLDRAEIDLVSLCSPRRDDQAAHAAAALQSGLHVLAEKPMATSIEQLAALQSASESAAGSLRTMTAMIYFPAIQGMMRVIENGEIGEIVSIYAMKSYPYHPNRPQDRGIDGGLICQAGIHAVGTILHLTGLHFDEVFAYDTGIGNPQPGDLQMGATISARMNNGAVASIVCNYCNPPKIGFWGNDQFRVHGTQGMIELVDGLTRRTQCLGENPPETFPDFDPPRPYPQDVVDAILDGTPSLLTPAAAMAETRTVLHIQQSVDQGRPVPCHL